VDKALLLVTALQHRLVTFVNFFCFNHINFAATWSNWSGAMHVCYVPAMKPIIWLKSWNCALTSITVLVQHKGKLQLISISDLIT